MLTVRCNILLVSSAWMLVASILVGNEPLTLLCVAVWTWIWIEWILFQFAVYGAKKFLGECEREVDGQGQKRLTAVTGRELEIEVRGQFSGLCRGYRILLADMISPTFEVTGGRNQELVDINSKLEFALRYRMKTLVCGRYVLPGLQLEIGDHWGFFRAEKFFSVNQELLVLPFLIRPQTTVSVLKRNNLQRILGHHRNKTPGGGTELLGVREYRIGDPPRSIAWKPTARLGKYMSSEYENLVPIRSTILVDLAAYQFWGRPGPAAADHSIAVSASIAKLLLADRDPVSTIILKSDSMKHLQHGSGERQLTLLMQQLLESSNPNPPLSHLKIDLLVKLVFENACRRFPSLFDERFNSGFSRSRSVFIGKREVDSQRRSLAVCLEHLFKLDAGLSIRLQYDDELMKKWCEKYSEKYNINHSSINRTANLPWMNAATWESECNHMNQRVCWALDQARVKAKDNELFVMVAPEPSGKLARERTIKSIRLAIADGHRVIFIGPLSPPPNVEIHDPIAARISKSRPEFEGATAESLFQFKISAIGATYARIGDPNLIQTVAMQVGLLQSAMGRGRSASKRY